MDQDQTDHGIDQVVGLDQATAALRGIRKSANFIKSPTLSKLLEYLVEHSYSADTHALSAYAIGADCLGLGAQFDPNVNPHVRVTIGRLRNALASYYLTAGATDIVRIEIPKGGTGVVFRHSVTQTPALSNPSNFLDRIKPFSTIDPRFREGYYACFFPSFTVEGAIMSHLIKIVQLERTYIFTSICRLHNPNSDLKCLSPVKFTGEFFHLNGKYFCFYAESPNPSMLAFLSLEGADHRFSGTANAHQTLVGVNAALSADRGRSPQATPVALSYIGKTIDIRSEIAKTGYSDISADHIPNAIKPYLNAKDVLSVDGKM